MSFCKLGGYQKVTHDSLNIEIQSLLSVAGISSKREEKDSFRLHDPSSGLKGDLTIFNFPQSASKGKISVPVCPGAPDGRVSQLTTDTSTASSTRGPSATPLLKSEATCELRAASRAYNSKCAKYSEVCSLIGLKFLPATFESSGKLHPATGSFSSTAMNTVSGGMSFESKSTTSFYWSARLSCCLHKSTAQALLRKCSSCSGKAVHGLHFSHSSRSNMIARDLATLHCNTSDSSMFTACG